MNARECAFTSSTATSVDGSRPTIVAGSRSLFEKLTSTLLAPWTTWKFVTMCPALSMTKPEPSACCVVVCGAPNGSRNGSGCVVTFEVAVTWTTPGAARV